MLSNNSSSSIQARRKLHRRQQSLEVPILAAPLPAYPRRNPPGHQGHRRGLSLDQSLSTLKSPNGYRPIPPQEHIQQLPSGSPSVRIQLDTTNTGPPPSDQQHFVQVTQQQRPAQPGYPAQDFQAHLQQQISGNFNAPSIELQPSPIASPQPSHPSQQAALQQLQHHMEWYQSTFGSSSPNPNMPTVEISQPVGVEMSGGLPMQQQPMHGLPQTPLSQGHSRTVPNTPQGYVNNWPSPPPADVKHARSQSFQLDVAPMPGSFTGHQPQMMHTPHDSFGHDATMFANDQGYASSAYSSSVVDPMSPGPQYTQGRMPTLFEEPSSSLGVPVTQGGFNSSSLLLQATAGAAPDFNDQDFDFGGPIGLSPNQALLNNLGPDVPASIVDTGIPAYEIQRYIGELSEADNKYPCMYEGCNRRFGRKENVRAHVQTHLGDRQFKCNLCDKTFVRQHDLKRHVAIHSEDRPFVCPCGTGFARHDALTRHRQRGMCHGALPGFEKNEEDKPKRGRPKKNRPEMEARVDKANRTRKSNKEKAAGKAETEGVYASSTSGASDRSFPVTPPDTSDAFDTDAFLDLASGQAQFNANTSSWRDTPPTSPASASPSKTAENVDPRNEAFDFNAPLDQGISPSVLSNHSSPPADHSSTTAGDSPHNIFDYASPAASQHAHAHAYTGGSFNGGSSPADVDFFNDFDAAIGSEPNPGFDAFSPPGESNASSSVYNSDGGDDTFDLLVHPEPSMHVGAKAAADMLPSAIFTEVDSAGRSLADVLDDWINAH